MDNRTFEAIGVRLEQCQKTLFAVREKANDLDRPEEVAMVDDMISLGLQFALYLTLMIEGKSTDTAPLVEVQEYCDLIEELGKEL